MSLPSANAQFTLDIPYHGEPWAGGTAQRGLVLTLDTPYWGEPFTTNEVLSGAANIDLRTLDFEYYGEPFAGGPLVANTNLFTLDYDTYGEPVAINNSLATITPEAVVVTARRRVIFIT